MHEAPTHSVWPWSSRRWAVSAAGCGKYSISNIRSLKAFQDGNNLYKKDEYKAAIERYEASLQLNPDLGFAYFFLGNSYDNLYKPAKKGEPANDANLPKAVENYRIAIQKMAARHRPEGAGDPEARLRVPDRGLRPGEAQRFLRRPSPWPGS